MIMSRDQNAGRSQYMKINNDSLERVVESKYFGTNLKNQNPFQGEIRSGLNSANTCYNSVKNLLSSNLLSKNLNIKIYWTIILPVVLYGCETWWLTLRGERRLKAFRNWVLRRIFWHRMGEVTVTWNKQHKGEPNDLFYSPLFFA